METVGKIIIIILSALIILFGVFGIIYFVTGGGDNEKIVFWKVDSVPEDAQIIHLSEEDFEKYPILREIPKTFDIDKSIFGPLMNIFGSVDKKTAYQIIEDYYGHRYNKRYIEYGGVIYQVQNWVS